MDIFAKYATLWDDKKLGFGKESYQAARDAGLTNIQLQKGLVGKRVGRIATDKISKGAIDEIQTSFKDALTQQATEFSSYRRKQETEMKNMRQKLLEAQARQNFPQQSAQVLGPGKSMVIRPGGSSRFSRPELQIKSMNI